MSQNKHAPQNVNPFYSHNFKFEVYRLPELTFFCTGVTAPGLRLNQSTATGRFVPYSVPNGVSYDDVISVRFTVDEEFRNWVSIFDWMANLGYMRNHEQFTGSTNENPQDFERKETSDCSLHILSNNKNTRGIIFKYFDCYPINLSSIEFDSTQTEGSVVQATAQFQYQLYKIQTPYRDEIGLP